jgi:hypothetical protein
VTGVAVAISGDSARAVLDRCLDVHRSELLNNAKFIDELERLFVSGRVVNLEAARQLKRLTGDVRATMQQRRDLIAFLMGIQTAIEYVDRP